MKLALIGTGYVGLVSGACFAELGHNVICVDIDKVKIDNLKKGIIPIYEPGLDEMVKKNIKAGKIQFTTSISEAAKNSEVIFIAVGTPPRPDGSADLSYVENVARDIAQNMNKYTIIVEKSTVPVETGEQVQKTVKENNVNNVEFDVVSNPEFLREGTAIHDTMNPDRIVIGVSTERAAKKMKELYSCIKAPVLVTDIKSAELIKHASNSFLSVKISFINAIAKICDITGADVNMVADGMGMDKRIGRSFLNAGIGYGGFCFPKDVEAFIHIAKKSGYEFNLLQECQNINEEMRKYFIKKVEKELWIVKDKTIGVLGLAFKPNTDDMRFAPSIDIINALHKEGAKIKAYDPVSMDKAKHVLPSITYCKDAYDVAKDCDLLLIVTEWNDFKEMDLKKIKSLMKFPKIIDGRNIFEPEKMHALGFKYVCIGRH